MANKRKRRSGRGAWAGLLAFSGALTISQCLVGRWCEPPKCFALEAKWADFERCADDVDIVFIGTSRVERHIDPRVVDRALAARGTTARSYNLGLPKLSTLEAAEIIQRLAKRRPRRLKLVVLEPTLYIYDAENWSTDRAMAQHDWSGTRRAIRLTWASESRRGTSWWGKLKCVAPHGLSFLCRISGLRRGERLMSGSPEALPISPTAAARGFAPLPVDCADEIPGGWRQRFRRFLRHEADWNGTGLSRDELAFLDGLLDDIRQIGAEPLLLLGPKIKRDSHTAAAYTSRRDRYADVAFLDYLRGHGKQQIYQLPYWHDFDHLNIEGAAVFSRELAGDLSALLIRRCAEVENDRRSTSATARTAQVAPRASSPHARHVTTAAADPSQLNLPCF